ncbi:hypothetical protein INS49_012690 [Diaporthe citri]|uniref:uncharacterized protein n=1 Tax=Diaporthe citri TaxID=83186 RepID=UPI001C81819C|nr:uncharacterized protein INS49_012690 [Diaporthe citri]KAG6359170.1 hypothetical protein INS49_012690 [Diaporthe citri]
MAFHQPTRQVARRTSRAVDPNSADLEALAPRPPLTQSRDESQTWVLFSPATDSGTSVSYLSSIQDDQPTPGRSRISDIGSLQTIAHSDNLYSEPANSDVLEEDDAIEDDAEFDSLDSHLPDFLHRGQQGGNTQSTTILPGHDGLGGFRLDTQGLATEMQETMYQFERYNPRRVKRRRESLELGQLALESEEAQEADRRRRIEEWRLEQSRVLLQEIQKETRRRRESTVSALTDRLRRGSQGFVEAEAEDAALSTVGDPTPDASMAGTEWHDQDASEMNLGAGETEEAGYWTRITRSVIRDLMGIDDKLLCVLFGEALPEDLDLDTDDLSSTPRAAAPGSNVAESESSWQLQLLDRMARELGDLVNQLSAHPHPGAFSTYTRMQQMPLPYAGLPVIPETMTTPTQYASLQAVPTASEPNEAKRHAPSRRSSNAEESTMPSMPKFQPTLQAVPHAQPMDIPRTKTADGPGEASGAEKLTGTFTQQEWEQDLDIKLVFRYLRNRFTSSRAAASNQSGHTQSAAHNTSSAQDAAARAAARVRQHHPLVRGVHSHQRRTSFKVSVPAGAPSQLVRHASSCASQSTKRSGRRGSMSVSSRHSSRHYWDIGARDGAGSIGTGSMIASTGPMGSWGEV